MIGCPYCGTLNRKGSRYCCNCGERLDTVPSTRCPSCNAPNLASNETCAFCGAALRLDEEEPQMGTAPSAEVAAPAAEAAGEAAPPNRGGTPWSCRPKTGQAGEPESPVPEALPSWLYDLPAEEEEPLLPDAVSSAPPEDESAKPNRYLGDMDGALPKTDGWLTQSLARHLSTADHEARPPEGA